MWGKVILGIIVGLATIGFFMFCIVSILLRFFAVDFGTIGLISSILTVLLVIGSNFDDLKLAYYYRPDWKAYDKSIADYKMDNLREQENYEIMQNDQRKILAKYPEYEHQKRQSGLKDLIRTNYAEILRNSQILNDSSIRKGLSEIYFYNVLSKIERFKVYKSLKYGYYFPDIVIVDKISYLVFDIEIDEPYTLEDKAPVHYGNIDSARNEYFVNNGFLVIRFTEEQVIYYTNECVQIISEVADAFILFKELTEVDKINSDIFSKILSKSWDYQEAFDLAYNNSRDAVIKQLYKRII